MANDYGKGSKQRPAAVSREEMDREWSRIFGGADPSKEPAVLATSASAVQRYLVERDNA